MKPEQLHSLFQNNSEVLIVFVEEATELLQQINKVLQDCLVSYKKESQDAILRDLHTLKGCASLIGYRTLQSISHQLEETIKQQTLKCLLASKKDLTTIEEIIQFMLDAIQQIGNKHILNPPINLIQDFEALCGHGKVETEQLETSSQIAIKSQDESVRIKLKLATIEKITQLCHDLIGEHSEILWQSESLTIHADTHNAMRTTIKRKIESLLESVHKNDELQSVRPDLDQCLTLVETLDNSENQFQAKLENLSLMLEHQEKLLNALDAKMTHTKLVDFSSYLPRLKTIIKQTAKKLNKEITLIVETIDVKVDKYIIERLMPAFEHLIRNAIDHGIESKDTRAKKHKPEVGHIYFSLRRVGNQIIFTLRDDGAGLDLDAITQKAIKDKLIEPGTKLDKTSAIFFLLKPGFSTKEAASSISGRGIGMDVINHIVQNLGGTLNVDFEQNIFTVVQLILPATLSQHGSILFQINNIKYAVATNSMIGFTRMTWQANNQHDPNPSILYDNKTYPLYRLSSPEEDQLMTLPAHKESKPVAIIDHPRSPYALLLDKIYGTRTLVIQPIPNIASNLWAFQGISLLSEREIVYCIEPTYFFQYLQENANTLCKR